MEDIIYKNLDVIITIVFGLLGIWAIWYFLMLPKLKYTLEILPFVNPTDVEKKIKSRLKILYDNKEVHRLSIAKITIYNKGKGIAEIFSQPIKILFNTKILAAYPNEEVYTSGIIAKNGITENENVIEFLPQYINPNEKIIFNAVLETPNKLDVRVTGRCKGCSNIKKIRSYKYLVYFIIFALGFSFPLILSSYLEHQSKTIIEKLEKTNIEIKTISTAIEDKIESLEQRNKKVEDKMEKTNKGVLLCKKAEEICSLCKYGVTLAIAKNVSLSEIEKIDLISKIDKFSSDMEMLNIKDESTQPPK
mgnify:CR=1 FL=1